MGYDVKERATFHVFIEKGTNGRIGGGGEGGRGQQGRQERGGKVGLKKGY